MFGFFVFFGITKHSYFNIYDFILHIVNKHVFSVMWNWYCFMCVCLVCGFCVCGWFDGRSRIVLVVVVFFCSRVGGEKVVDFLLLV